MKDIKKTFLLIAIAFSLNFQLINAQGNWELVYEETIELGLIKGICFVAGPDESWDHGWAVMYNGSVLKTTNSGETWTKYTQTLSTAIWGISFADEDTGYLSGNDGKILKSTDGGVTWVTVYNNSNDSFNKVKFKDDMNGVAVGNPNNIYTSDGGTTWTTSSGTSGYWGLDYAYDGTYYAVDAFDGNIGRTEDDGENWSNPYTSAFDLTICVDFLDANHGIVGGSNYDIKYTHDGGDSWQSTNVDSGNGEVLAAGWFDQDTVWACGVGIYKSTNGGADWDQDTTMWGDQFANREMFVSPLNIVYVSADNLLEEKRQIWRKVGESPLYIDFEGDPLTLCSGGSVDFTDLSFGNNITREWTFEGGNPSSSTEENVTVTYNTPGYYDVELTITDGTNTETLTKTEYISVLETPGEASQPVGEQEVCTNNIYEYSIDPVDYAQDYEWVLSPSSAGVLTSDMTMASLQTDEEWTGDFTVKVRATNLCGDGDWSEEIECTLFTSPEEFTLEGGGGFCQGEEGAEITLDGSESGVEYELFFEGESTGIVIDGTGSEISFGFLDEEGSYSATGSNENCVYDMINQVDVTILYAPVEPATPTGPIEVCNDMTSNYVSEGNDDSDSYVWTVSPEDAGTLTADGLTATVEWNTTFDGTANVSIAGENECGLGNESSLEVEVQGNISPEISGSEMVCDLEEEVYEVVENEGSTYMWTVTGGTIIDGQGSNLITVSWGVPGSGTVEVSEETAIGCSGNSEVFQVTIDDCTGIEEIFISNSLSLYPNPADQYLNVQFISPSEANYDIIVMNQLGQIILEKTQNSVMGNSTIRIDVANSNRGIYLLQLRKDGTIITTKQFSKN